MNGERVMKKQSKVKFIDTGKISYCWACDGKGRTDKGGCKVCEGNGKWKEESYILVYKNKEGKKIAFAVDGLK
jgi:DnaJ-class molecular chaperone